MLSAAVFERCFCIREDGIASRTDGLDEASRGSIRRAVREWNAIAEASARRYGEFERLFRESF
jgi:hypothetical protein